jgi:oligopeptide/dipeptide ABC transporter ATP-binding protein
MYLGQVMEISPSEALFSAPRHPYSKALLDAAPELDPTRRNRTVAARGELPSPLNLPPGCPFASRCPHVFDRCRVERPLLTPRGTGQRAACHLTEFGAPLLEQGI